jgi:hypothetical protein
MPWQCLKNKNKCIKTDIKISVAAGYRTFDFKEKVSNFTFAPSVAGNQCGNFND